MKFSDILKKLGVNPEEELEEEPKEEEVPTEDELTSIRNLLAKYDKEPESADTEEPKVEETKEESKPPVRRASSQTRKPDTNSKAKDLESILNQESFDKELEDGSLEKLFNATVSR